MGVSGLLEILRPYRELTSLRGFDVVIDGPSLAHHLYHILVKSRNSALNFHEANPSYREVGESVLAWLSGLRLSGAHVRRIYFDGYLPHTKVPVRLKRRVKHALRLKEYLHRYAGGVPYDPARTQLHISQYNSFPYEHGLVGPTIFKLPSSSFLVPSVIEALSASKEVEDVIEIVPGEADAYCAEYLRQNGGLVFSSDSDLLIHDLGRKGAMAYFDDVHQTSELGIRELHAYIFRPALIAELVNLPTEYGVRALAFELIQHRKGSLEQHLTRATQAFSIQNHMGKYRQFNEEYEPIKEGLSEMLLPGVNLDPRVSEYVLQYRLKDTSTKAEETKRFFFLPLLVDSLVKSNAYEISTPLRQIAYTMMNLTLPEKEQCSVVYEYSRQLNTLNGKPTLVLEPQKLPHACLDVMYDLDAIFKKQPHLSSEEFWVAVMVLQDVRWAISREKEPISVLFAKNDISNSKDNKVLDWILLHFLAQFHGSYYSFRITKQIINFLNAGNLATLPDEALKLGTCLDKLPRLDVLPDIAYAWSVLPKLDIEAMVTAAYEILGAGSPDWRSVADMVQNTHLGATEIEKQSRRSFPQTSNNPFGLLAVD